MNYRIIFLITLLLLIIIDTRSQVTIGSNQVPKEGSLLDLKEDGTFSNNASASKGLGMPRIKLTDKSNLYPMFETAPGSGTPNSDYNDIIKKNNQDALHIGLMVYNVTHQDRDFCRGLYVWTGTEWTAVQRTADKTSESLDQTTGLGTLTDHEGKTYTVAKFGNTAGWWMTQNLATESTFLCENVPFILEVEPGTGLTRLPRIGYPQSTAVSVRVATNIRPSDFDTNYKIGVLYNWTAASLGENVTTVNQGHGTPNELTVGIRGICPKGWHLPSDREWNELEIEINNNPSLYAVGYGTPPPAWTEVYPAGGAWRGSHSRLMQAVNNLSSPAGYSKLGSMGGFDALLVGYGDGGFTNNFGTYAMIWTSSNYSVYNVWARDLINTLTGVYRFNPPYNRLQSVRCKRD